MTTSISSRAARSFRRTVRTASMGGDGRAWSRESAVVATPGLAEFNPMQTYDQKRVGSLSPSSRATQAKRKGCGEIRLGEIQSARSVVLPKPAGAEISVRG